MSPDPNSFEPLAYRLASFCAVTGLTRTEVYRQMQLGNLRWYSVGRHRFITADEARRFVNAQMTAASGESAPKPESPETPTRPDPDSTRPSPRRAPTRRRSHASMAGAR